MISKGRLKSKLLTQKYNCQCFYRTSKTNKKAKRSSNKRLRNFLNKDMDI